MLRHLMGRCRRALERWPYTLLYLMGIDHERLTYKFQGQRFRLTDVEGRIVKNILS